MGARQRRWQRSAPTVEAAVKRAVSVARAEHRITPYDEPFITLAMIVAVQLDHAAAQHNAGDVARLVKPLRDLLHDLPLRGLVVPPPEPPDPVDAELQQLLDASPTTG